MDGIGNQELIIVITYNLIFCLNELKISNIGKVTFQQNQKVQIIHSKSGYLYINNKHKSKLNNVGNIS